MMKRYELYVDNDNRLVVSEFKTIHSEYESKILRGAQTYDIIKKLASSKIVDFYEFKKRNDLVLEYKDYIININEYDKVFMKRGTGTLLKNIKDYSEAQQAKKLEEQKAKKVTPQNPTEPPKVKRKNKHTGKKIIATGLTLIMLAACANNLLKKEPEQTNDNTYSTTQTDENKFVNEDTTVNKDIEQEDKKDVQITPTKQTEKKPELINLSFENEVETICLDYEDWSSSKKAFITRAYYSQMITKYANMYGLDPDLVIAVATQESRSGIHTTVMDPGGATGLMQIQNSVWVGNDVSAYNFETGKVETLKVTKERIQDVSYNIRIGCMILQNTMEYMKYNTLAGIQCYNMGYGNMMKILNACSKDTGRSVDEILKDVNNTDWMNYRKIITVGEKEYVERVLSWMGEDVNIKILKRDGSPVSINVGNQLDSKKVY